ncbi:MAG TPA: heme o synthase [Haliangiales bacterium]|nr:heme o synthase [Haliangiales bacterium]
MTALRDWISLTKPRISLLNVATTAAGLALAGGGPASLWAATLVGTLLLVGSANTLNQYLERDIDAKMARTRGRPLPSGRVRPGTALALGVIQAAIAVPLVTFCANALAGLLGAIALVLYVLVYTPLKQKSIYALHVGAIPGAMPPLLGFTAATGQITAPALALFGVVFFWQIPHFLALAIALRDDYRAAGLKVMPNERGDEATRRAIVVYLVLQVLTTLALVPLGVGGPAYLAGAALLGAAVVGGGMFGLWGGGERWARGLFLASIAYLPVLLGLMLIS